MGSKLIHCPFQRWIFRLGFYPPSLFRALFQREWIACPTKNQSEWPNDDEVKHTQNKPGLEIANCLCDEPPALPKPFSHVFTRRTSICGRDKQRFADWTPPHACCHIAKLRGLSEANRPMRTSQHLLRRLNGDYVHRRRTAVDYNESTRCRRLARQWNVNTEAALSAASI